MSDNKVSVISFACKEGYLFRTFIAINGLMNHFHVSRHLVHSTNPEMAGSLWKSFTDLWTRFVSRFPLNSSRFVKHLSALEEIHTARDNTPT